MTLSTAVRLEILDHYDWTCYYCTSGLHESKQPWVERPGGADAFTIATVDHVDPWGGDDPENLVAACLSCNAAKGRRTFTRWMLDVAVSGVAWPAHARRGLTHFDATHPHNRAWLMGQGVRVVSPWERRMAHGLYRRVACDVCSDLPFHEITTP